MALEMAVGRHYERASASVKSCGCWRDVEMSSSRKERSVTDLGTETVNTMPLSSVGLAGPGAVSTTPGGGFEMALFFQMGRE